MLNAFWNSTVSKNIMLIFSSKLLSLNKNIFKVTLGQYRAGELQKQNFTSTYLTAQTLFCFNTENIT